MGDAQLSSHTPPSGMVWSSSPTGTTIPDDYVVIPDDESVMGSYLATPLSASPSGAFAIQQQQYNIPIYPNSPEPLTTHSGVSSSPYEAQYPYTHTQNRAMQVNPALASHLGPDIVSISPVPTPTPVPHARSSRQEKPEDEIRRLQAKVRELEYNYELARRRIRDLEQQLRTEHGSIVPGSSTALAGLPTPLPSPSFQQEWHARTEARKKFLCSLNRAGNALCSWHDSRRERRAYPPRMVPPGYLNCGCTFEEALFEESLSRHNVGSYLPGESVRMDPALRNPLLKLLERRYGYKDGDFERDPLTGNWVEGEGAALWRAQLAQGSSAKKQRGEERR